MNWPSMSDYQEAIQNPKICFYDQDLKNGSPVLDALNLPKPITGAFASVYEIKTGHSKNAVRCFLKHFDDQENRYQIISSYLSKINLNYFAKFEFLLKGILIKGKWYPILKMEWINGLSLNQYIEKNLSNPQVLNNLRNDFLDLINTLNKHSIAHGDLQHGNILISNGKIKLVDYDGMYVPGLDGRISNEIGHHNYQHPKRTENDFGKSIDNFSSWIIYTSLVALYLDPSIWNRMKGGDEHLLFNKEDFVNPNNSDLFNELSNSNNSELIYLSNNIISFLNFGVSQVPILTKGVINPPISQTQKFINSRQTWINDHIHGKQVAKGSSLTWISSHKKIKFNSSAISGQIVLFGGTGIIFLSFMGGYLGNIPILVNSIGVFLISLISSILFLYYNTPEVYEKRKIHNNIPSK